MQASELEPGLADSQEWVDVPQDRVTEEGITATTVETPQGEGENVDETVTAAQQPEVNRMELMFRSSRLICRSRRRLYQGLETLIGPRTKKVGFHLSPDYKPSLERLGRLLLRTWHKIYRIRIQQGRYLRLKMVACQTTRRASRKLAADVAGNVVIVVSEEVEVESVEVSVVAIAAVSAEVSGESVAARGVSAPSYQ